MEINAITLDKAMVHAILSAFSVAEHEGMSSLVSADKTISEQPSGKEFVKAEFRVLQALHSIYPEIVNEYFEIEKQMEYGNKK